MGWQDSATIIAQLVNHHTDVHKVLVDSYAWFYVFSLTDSASGVQQQVPNPPRALRDAWLRQSELYEELIDTIEIQLVSGTTFRLHNPSNSSSLSATSLGRRRLSNRARAGKVQTKGRGRGTAEERNDSWQEGEETFSLHRHPPV